MACSLCNLSGVATTQSSASFPHLKNSSDDEYNLRSDNEKFLRAYSSLSLLVSHTAVISALSIKEFP